MTFNHEVLVTNPTTLTLSNGHRLSFVTQKDARTLLFKADEEAAGASVTGLGQGEIESLHSLEVDVTSIVLPSAQKPTGTAIPEDGVKNLVHTKPELIIEAEELDFAREERPNDSLPKGEKKLVQEGQVGRKLHLVEVSQENGVESRKEIDAFVEVEPVAEITEVGTKEVPAENPSDKPTPTPEDPTNKPTLPGTAVPEEGVKNLVHSKPELIIEAEELEFAHQERPNDQLPKGEQRVIQAGRKGRQLHFVQVSQDNGVETRTVIDSLVESEALAEIIEVGTKESLANPHAPSSSVVSDSHEEGVKVAVTAAQTSLPDTGSDESVANLVAGLLAAGLAGVVLDDKKKRADKAK